MSIKSAYYNENSALIIKFHNITVFFTVIYGIFDQINAALTTRKDFFINKYQKSYQGTVISAVSSDSFTPRSITWG